MRLSVSTSNGSGLAAYAKRLQRLSKGDWRVPLYERIGARLHTLVEEGWANRADPYGNAWAPTQQPNPILEETGDMRGSVKHDVVGYTIVLRVDDIKAAYHQHGTKRGIVARRMLPEDELPPAWVEAIREECDAFFAEWLKG